jgi:carboxymethylenebutenolidase
MVGNFASKTKRNKENNDMGQTIELTAADGFKLAAYRAEPAGTPRGGLLVIQEIFGINSHIRSVCDGYAADGYLAVAPALFDRYERGVDIGYTPEDVARGVALKAKSGIDSALQDVEAARGVAAGAGKVGVVGYCWGGYVAWMSAARLSGFACALCYYGGGMLAAIAERPKCPVICHFGERDTGIPVAGVRQFAAAHPEIQVYIYAADHGFNCDQRGSYDAAAARLARERSLAFMRQHIG